jgi:hypothetical protein
MKIFVIGSLALALGASTVLAQGGGGTGQGQ